MKTLLPILAALLISACAQADAPAAPPPSSPASTEARPAPAASVVQRALARDGVTVTGSLEAPAGYHGYVARYQGRELPVYLLPDGKHIAIGTLLDLEGRDLTTPAMQKLANPSFGDAQWKALGSSNWVQEGNPDAGRIVYVFVDTRCPYCHHLWQAYQPWLKDGKVQVRNILVGVIAPESLPEAANILAASDPSAAWNRNEKNFGHNPTPKDDAPAADVDKVRANTRLMQQLGFMGTPGIIWKDAKGHIHTLQGMPRDRADIEAIFSD